MMTSGYVLADRYRLGERIATGGMGEVWDAVDTVLGRQVAVKVIRADLQNDAMFGARFRAEARTLATLHHPGVVDVYDYGELSQPGTGELAYLVMAFIHGETLSARIARAGHLTPADTMSLVGQAARALQAAHDAGAIHRDVKPDNFLIDADGRIVLIDFGVARTSDTTGLTGVQEVVGTALYMAPEQISRSELTPAVDVYALGAVAYHCLAGRPPFMGDNAIAVALSHLRDEPEPLPTSIPTQVRNVVLIAMDKDPTYRYPTAAAMAAAAEAAGISMTQPFAAADVAALEPTTGATVLEPAAGSAAPVGYQTAFDTAELPAMRRRRRMAPLLAAVVVGIGAIAVALVLALGHPDGGSPQHTGTSTGTTKPSPGGKTPAPSTHRGSSTTSSKPQPSASGPTTRPPSSTPTSPVTPTKTPPATPPTSAPGTGSGGGGGGGGGPSAPAGGADPTGTSTAAADTATD
jgi:eukaryotic-like serine/threonine-protein kinase